MAEPSPHLHLYAPTDGGTPRDAARIIAEDTATFRVLARDEEGNNPLTHAVSRVDLICRNDTGEPRSVTLKLDLSADGKRSNYDDNFWGGMPSRDFLFIRPPGGSWRQINGATDGWVSIVTFAALPGETEVGLSPWYTYGDYLHVIHSLPEHPHLRKTLLGQSDGGREHWELTLTDPQVPSDKKRVVFWHAREHGYETFSSFAIEGAIAYLLSDESAEARRRFVFVLHLMTNVDGVAEGFEYRTGYDYPTPRSSASGRLTFEAMDRLRPDFAVTWHNWIAPRDVDTLFYTDSHEHRPTRRAWDTFTQRFPSPRAVEHRWDDESDPLRKNWHGRTLSDNNVHQYAMKRYGTRVWGWEMPWWNRTVEDARRAGAAFVVAFLAALASAEEPPTVSDAETLETPLWEMIELAVPGVAHVENPCRDAAVIGEFTSPSGRTVTAEGFYDGGDTWRLRFAPDEEGEWSYLLRGEGVEAFRRGHVRCVSPKGQPMPEAGKGFIGIHPDNSYAFAYSDGSPFFPMGDTSYGFYSDSLVTPALRAEYLRTRRAQRFNFVRMGVVHSPTHWETDPAFWPWGGSWGNPDYDRLNPVYFQGLDSVLREMLAMGMNTELLVLNFYQLPFTNPKLWTPERERLWLRYVTARYAAFRNIFLWTIANEYETHPDGAYRLDFPEDVEWAKAAARFIKRRDPYRHPVTVHPVVSASARSRKPGPDYDPPWRIGEFYGVDDAMDVISQQTGQDGIWDDEQACWTGDDPNLVLSLRADRRYGKPVMNTENGYEYLRGFPTHKKQVHHTDKVRRSAWRLVCSGGYFSAGFAGTLGMSDYWNRIDAPNTYPFVVTDEGAAKQLGILYDFFAALPFSRMQPFDGVQGDAIAFAADDDCYVLYLPHGGKAILDLSRSGHAYTARGFDPRTGERGEDFAVEGGKLREFDAPDANDWTYLLNRTFAR